MNDALNTSGEAGVGDRFVAVEPDVDVLENGESYTIVADVPGVSREALGVEYEDGVLKLSAACRSASGGVKYERTFRVGDDVDMERASATVVGGVATVVLPKSVRSRPRRIEVAVG